MGMTKYRLLNNEELKSFEDEFVKYLVVNGIDADLWKKMLAENKTQAQQIVDLFSDVVFEKIMRQAKFLVIKRASYIQAIQCLDEKMIMVAISTNNKEIDMTTMDFSSLSNFEDFHIHKAEKTYQKERGKELFDLTELGYYISDGKLFKALILATV